MDDDQPRELRLKLLLELDRREPLGGEIGPADGRMRPFSGWIGLAGAINECLASTRLSAAELDSLEDPNR